MRWGGAVPSVCCGVRAVQDPRQAEGCACPSCSHAHHLPAFYPFAAIFTAVGPLRLKLLEVDGAIEEYEKSDRYPAPAPSLSFCTGASTS